MFESAKKRYRGKLSKELSCFVKKCLLEDDAKAWEWLLELPGFALKGMSCGEQEEWIKIQVCPKNLGSSSGAPLVGISVFDPTLNERVRASGKSLYIAVQRLHANLWQRGVKLPYVNRFLS